LHTSNSVANQLRTEVPFILPPALPATGTVRCGHGVIVCGVTAAANTPVVVKHGLARKVKAMWAIVNNGGASFAPQLLFTANGTQTVSIEGNLAMTNCAIVIF
jgi:hypothetical protein